MDIIKSSTDISDLFSRGRRIHTPNITLIVSTKECGRLDSPSGRVAFVAGKKNGNAVWRNGAKRRMREICRQQNLHQKGVDIVFLAKPGILKAPFFKVFDDVQRVSSRIERRNNEN